MHFFGCVRMRTAGLLAVISGVAVVGGLNGCGENDTLEPMDTGSNSSEPGTTTSSQASSTGTNSTTSKPNSGSTSSSATSTTTTTANSSTSTAPPTTSSTTSASTGTSSETQASSTTQTSSETSAANTSSSNEDSDTSEVTSSDETTGEGGKPAPDPSDGCGKANPQTGSAQQPLNVSNHQYYVKLPTNYDPEKPYPVVIGLHPTGQSNAFPWAEQNLGFEKNGAKDAAIRVYPQCADLGSGWNASDVSFFKPLHETILSNFCVDKGRVFVTGESSGGDFASIVGCEHGDILRGIGPCATKSVGQYPITNPDSRQCKGQVDAVIIHGINDRVVGAENGPATAEFYRKKNGCSADTIPVEGYTAASSNCKEYQGCDEGFQTFFCQHNEGTYSDQQGPTNHGWPTFAGNFLWEHWSEL